MRSALLLPSQNALDQLSRFPRPSQERINYLVQQISNLMSLLVALRKVAPGFLIFIYSEKKELS